MAFAQNAKASPCGEGRVIGGHMTTDQRVLLLGAGATRGALKGRKTAPPLDWDFFDIAGQIRGHGTEQLAASVARDVFDLYGRVSGVGLEQYFREIEARAEIGQIAESKNKPKNWARRQRDLEELIQRVLIETTGPDVRTMGQVEANRAEADVYKNVLRHVRSGDTIITFNYDIVIEESMPTEMSPWDPSNGYGFEASAVTLEWAHEWREKRGYTKSGSTFQLLKLHGSLNWTLYKAKKGARRGGRGDKVRLRDPYLVPARNDERCTILPPGWHKRIDRNPYRQLWQKALRELENCVSLTIIGYSLPETDLAARALLAEASRSRAADKRYLKDLHIADPSETVKERFVDLFKSALGPNGHVHRYKDIEELSSAWRDGRVRLSCFSDAVLCG
jgi:hypothetical protein